MAEKTGTLNGITVGYEGKTKNNKPYKIYNVELGFPSGKTFKLSVPSWSDIYRDIKEVPLGTGIKCEVDDKNNITDFKIIAPMNAPAPPVVPTPVAPAMPPIQIIQPDPVSPPESMADQKKSIRIRAIELAVEFYNSSTNSKKDMIAIEELVFSMAERIIEFINAEPSSINVTYKTLPNAVAPPTEKIEEDDTDDTPF